MKIRLDFVSNSSSSSFVIGKKDDESVTIESVYQMIRGFYQEMVEQREKAREYFKKHPYLGLQYIEENKFYNHFHYNKKKNTELDEKKKDRARKLLMEKFSIDIYDNFYSEYEWLKCETYKEYEEYWTAYRNLPKEKRHATLYAPFTIADFLEERAVNWLHFGHEHMQPEDEIHKVNSKSEVLEWYYEYATHAFEYEEWNREYFGGKACESCDMNIYCDKETCMEEKAIIDGMVIPEEHACLYLLGRVCIHSECGYIADYVVRKLMEVSEYGCNHMG